MEQPSKRARPILNIGEFIDYYYNEYSIQFNLPYIQRCLNWVLSLDDEDANLIDNIVKYIQKRMWHKYSNDLHYNNLICLAYLYYQYTSNPYFVFGRLNY
jgi:hypothetical protein